ncbi:hypothetical protein HOY80DRAFT_1049258 [Tuber brumale]|nr:hypothetical protein HOY80DRAFT_1049258 [Tuber brumale]
MAQRVFEVRVYFGMFFDSTWSSCENYEVGPGVEGPKFSPPSHTFMPSLRCDFGAILPKRNPNKSGLKIPENWPLYGPSKGPGLIKTDIRQGFRGLSIRVTTPSDTIDNSRLGRTAQALVPVSRNGCLRSFGAASGFLQFTWLSLEQCRRSASCRW